MIAEVPSAGQRVLSSPDHPDGGPVSGDGQDRCLHSLVDTPFGDDLFAVPIRRLWEEETG